jgi:hypothetical protein
MGYWDEGSEACFLQPRVVLVIVLGPGQGGLGHASLVQQAHHWTHLMLPTLKQSNISLDYRLYDLLA